MVGGRIGFYSHCARFLPINRQLFVSYIPNRYHFLSIFAEKINEMESIVQNIQPILLTALVGVIIAYARYVNTLKTRVAVLEQALEGLTKTIESMQKRLDSHSKKQDEIYDSLGDMKGDVSKMNLDIVKEMGIISASVSSLAAEVKGLSNLILASDKGLKIERM